MLSMTSTVDAIFSFASIFSSLINEEEEIDIISLSLLIVDKEDEDDDDEDEFDDDDEFDMMSPEDVMKSIDGTKTNTDDQNESVVVSPFDDKAENEADRIPVLDENGQLEFNSDNVCKVLDEIRPYLINDGGNVSVQRVDVDTRSVYLKLEGACGSCASSTVTMSMGIERVLKENFDNLGKVVQVEDEINNGEDSGANPNELTMEAVMSELKRVGPAITAMGGNVEVVSVDPIGVVELRFRGSTKVQQGLELALRDVPLVKHVKFVN